MAIDPPIKTRVTVDPDTGARVFNQSWSSELKKKEPIVRKPVSRETFVTEKKPVEKRTVSVKPRETTTKTSGERTFSEVIKPKPAGTTISSEIKASSLPDRKVTPKLTRKEIFDIKTNLETDKLKQRFPGMTIEQAKRKKQKESEEYYKKQSKSTGYQKNTGGDNSSKQKSSSACQSGCK